MTRVVGCVHILVMGGAKLICEHLGRIDTDVVYGLRPYVTAIALLHRLNQ